MAWEWSHTPEAYANAETNIRAKDRNWLETVYGEWHAEDEEDLNNFNEEKYQEAKARAKTLTEEELADFIWEKTSELRTCENGGYFTHCCPYGCNVHMASFSKSEED